MPDIYMLHGRTLNELKKFLDRSNLDLVWLQQNIDATEGETKKHFVNQLYREKKYRDAIEDEILRLEVGNGTHNIHSEAQD